MEEGGIDKPGPVHYTSALQQHVAFFDRNKDGKVYPHETYKGFRAIGYGPTMSVFAALFIHLGLSYKTLEGRVPSLLLPIYIKNIHRAKHRNDSGIYDEEGRLLQHKLNDLFREFGKTFPDRLSLKELTSMRNSFHKDSTRSGRLASKVEWEFAYHLLKDENGYISKEHIRRTLDGSIFHYLEEEHSKKRTTS